MATETNYGEFDSELQDEYTFDAHPPPGVEIGEEGDGGLPSFSEGLPPVPAGFIPDDVDFENIKPMRIAPSYGSGSYAEDGPLEVADNVNIYNGENMSQVGGIEDEDTVGAKKRAVAHATKAVQKAQLAVKKAPPHVAAKHVAAAHKAVAAAEYVAASGPYAQSGATEIGAGLYPVDGASEIGLAAEGGYIAKYGPSEIGGVEDEDAVGAVKKAVARATQAVKKAQLAVKKAPPHVAAKHVAAAQRATAAAEHAVASGPYAQSGASEIGAGLYPVDGASEIGAGWAAAEGQSEVGAGLYPVDGASELGAGLYPEDGASELGEEDYGQFARRRARFRAGQGYNAPVLAPAGEDYGQVARRQAALRAGQQYSAPVYVLGEEDDTAAPFESFMLEPTRMGDEDAAEEQSEPIEGLDDSFDDDLQLAYNSSEIGAEQAKIAVVKVVKQARDNRKPAPPMKAVDVDAPFPDDAADFLSDIVLGAAVASPAGKDPFPRLTQFLVRAGAGMDPRVVRVDTEESYKQFRTEQSPELSELRALRQRLEDHISDPNAHELTPDIDDDIAELVEIGAHAQEVEAQKRVDLWMPKRFEGKLEAWREGDNVCASLALPGPDGEVRICTSLEPVRKCVDEMTRHAAEADVAPATVVGVLPAMGCVLGAGTVIKEVAAAAPAILARPEAKSKAPFVVRIEPKTAPNLAALAMLASAARRGDAQAQDEWKRLGEISAPPVKKAMLEAVRVAKSATGG